MVRRARGASAGSARSSACAPSGGAMMPDVALARLHTRARYAYERGRLLSALRVAAIVVPLAALCARETGAWQRCAIVGVVLLAVSTAARWRVPRGRRSVDAGLRTGVIPLAAALVLCRFASTWPDEAAFGVCTTAGLVAGTLAWRAIAGSPDGDRVEWATASIVGGLTAALGCIGIGFGTAAGASLGVAAGAIAGLAKKPFSPKRGVGI